MTHELIFDPDHQAFLKDLTALWDQNRLHHGWILQSPDSLLAKKIVFSLAQTFFQKSGFERSLEEIPHPDFCYVDAQTTQTAAHKISVEDVRMVTQFAMKSVLKAPCKVILIHQADRMTPQAQNALLKTLEAPPKQVYFFLTVTSVEGVLPTIRSRCQKKVLPVLSFDGFGHALKGQDFFEHMTRSHQAGLYALTGGNLETAMQGEQEDLYEAFVGFLKAVSPLILSQSHSESIDYLNKVVASRDEGKMKRFQEYLLQMLVFLKEAHLGALQAPFQTLFEDLKNKTSLPVVAACYGGLLTYFKETSFLMMDARQTATNALRQLEILSREQ